MKFYEKFFPKKTFDSVLDIDMKFIKENNLKAIFLDVDNTILDYDGNVIEGIENWIQNLKENNIKICILSNTRKKKKAERISKMLDLPYIYLATKPFKRGFKKAKKLLDIKNNSEIAAVGDQILTDVFGANRAGIYSILVKPIKDKDILITRFNRIIERRVLKKYYEQNKREVN